jgi:hypothetical protein
MATNTELDLGELTQFLLRARKQGWAGSGQKVIVGPQRPGFKEFYYKERNWEYTDSYTGYYYAPGQEVVRFKDIPVWNMAYNGGMTPEYHGRLKFSKEVNVFLKKALLKVESEKPFRGPTWFVEGDFEYLNHSEGDISNFKGTERIMHCGKEVFKQDYIGGLIIHK